MRFETKIYIISLVLLLGIFFSISSFFIMTGSPTGMVVVEDPELLQEELQMLSRGDLFQLFGEDTNLCIIIPDINDSYSFDLDKNSEFFEVSASDDLYCDGLNKEDMVIKFNDYASFKNYDDLTCDFKSGRAGQDYYILPSRFIEENTGSVTCNDEFRDKFCPLIKECMSDKEISSASIVGCCDDYPEEESPSNFSIDAISGLISMIIDNIFFILIPIIIIVIIVGVFMFMKIHNGSDDGDDNSELREYIQNCLSQGYQDFQIRNILIQEGWDQTLVDSTFQQVRGQNPQDPGQRFMNAY